MPDYALGNAPPRAQSDIGSGPWCSEQQTARFLLYKRALEAALDTHALTLSPGPDAVRHMRHYLNNTGQDLPVDVAALMDRSAQLSKQYVSELADAQAFAQTLAVGRHHIHSTRLAQGYFRQSQDANLFFAIGGYSYWGQASVTVADDEQAGKRYEMDFSFEFFDRYNWDGGKQVTLAGVIITDAFMQNFHRQCYAREYDLRGTLTQRLRWAHGHPAQGVHARSTQASGTQARP
ncbi:hypothetical protein HLB44_07840 [Aquincola sp. S2]|uniref:Uncharacterized protein n=1 Tax=Pseudaquabacterium terrae TaxID=2732868 RepID=A0ABX2EE49_9BURK|nr:hypothetical protein [Aquabacterium terrae]NRF66891.1 hypothetical protein [Aquabacterium terrae]